MENGEAVAQAAREAIDQHGDSAVSILRERAEVAEPSAKAWRDIADLADKTLSPKIPLALDRRGSTQADLE